MKIIPDKFMPVQMSEKDVQDWDDLERVRSRRAPVLGLDDWGETAKYNITMLLFCDMTSKAFVWVILSVALILYFGVKDSSLLIYNLVGSLLHFAAKDEFKKVVAAFCVKWGGPLGGQSGKPVTPTATATASPTQPAVPVSPPV